MEGELGTAAGLTKEDWLGKMSESKKHLETALAFWDQSLSM